MKKISRLLLSVVLILSMVALPLTACKKDDKNVIRLCEVTHSVFYAPLYVAINKGYFEEEGLTIELTDGGGADNVMTALISDSADIGLMGPEATVYVQVKGAKNYPMIFGQLTKCDGSFLVGRTEQPDFKWSDLKGKNVIGGRKGGMPAMTFQYVMNQNGVQLSDLNKFDQIIAFNLMGPTFASDKSWDYVPLFEPAASNLVKAGGGHIIKSIGEASGDVPFTAFSAMSSYMKDNRENAKKFLKCIMRAYEFVAANEQTPEVVAAALQDSFKTNTIAELSKVVESYFAIKAWKDTPVMLSKDFDLLQNILQNADTLPIKTTFDKCVDNSIAEELVQEMKK